jgi:hypothetical protein
MSNEPEDLFLNVTGMTRNPCNKLTLEGTASKLFTEFPPRAAYEPVGSKKGCQWHDRYGGLPASATIK